MHLSPAEYVISQFKGVRATARALGVDHSIVSRWRSKGRVPTGKQRVILDKAKEMGLKITPADLILGRVVREIA